MSVQDLKLGLGSSLVPRYGAANRPHGGLKLWSQKGVFWHTQK